MRVKLRRDGQGLDYTMRVVLRRGGQGLNYTMRVVLRRGGQGFNYTMKVVLRRGGQGLKLYNESSAKEEDRVCLQLTYKNSGEARFSVNNNKNCKQGSYINFTREQ